MNYQKAPFPYFGGKSKAAPVVWAALGDVAHYVEPFCGTMAVLLNRPHLANRPHYSETVNDFDGLLVNAWRSIQLHPEATAVAASNPVAEADLHARHCALVRWRHEHQLEHLMGDPAWCDPTMGGWWLWGIASWIGSGWGSGTGPWSPDDTGRLTRTGQPGVNRQRPDINGNGMGVNRPGLREPGVRRQLPAIGNDGRGVNHLGLREPGVEWHDVTMPQLVDWFAWLSARLRHVRVLNGDWKRAVTRGATKTIPVRMGDGHCGIFLDPPYADTAGRADGLYAHDDLQVAHQVREWCLNHGADPDYRIVLAGFDGEHGTELTDAGWAETEWFKAGYLTGGMAQQNADGHQQHRERFWMSPHCTAPVAAEDVDGYQPGLFDR